MEILKILHITVALLSVAGFVIRLAWRYVAPDLLAQKWVRISPHIVDTVLLVSGFVLAFNLPGGLAQGWLIAKLIGLLFYIGFGVMALRGEGTKGKVGAVGALVSVTYILLVAITENVLVF